MVKKASSEQRFCGIVDERDPRTMVRLVWVDRNSMLTQISTLYNCSEHKSISRSTTRLRQIWKRQQKIRVLSAKSHWNWPAEDWIRPSNIFPVFMSDTQTMPRLKSLRSPSTVITPNWCFDVNSNWGSKPASAWFCALLPHDWLIG